MSPCPCPYNIHWEFVFFSLVPNAIFYLRIYAGHLQKFPLFLKLLICAILPHSIEFFYQEYFARVYIFSVILDYLYEKIWILEIAFHFLSFSSIRMSVLRSSKVSGIWIFCDFFSSAIEFRDHLLHFVNYRIAEVVIEFVRLVCSKLFIKCVIAVIAKSDFMKSRGIRRRL